MALEGKHQFGAIDDQRVTFVEKKIEKDRVEFLKRMVTLDGENIDCRDEAHQKYMEEEWLRPK